MGPDVNTIFQIAGIGIVVAMLHTVLKQMGRDDVAHWVTFFAFIIVLYMVASVVDNLFQKIKGVFLFQ